MCKLLLSVSISILFLISIFLSCDAEDVVFKEEDLKPFMEHYCNGKPSEKDIVEFNKCLTIIPSQVRSK